MIDYLRPDLASELKAISTLGLAHVGDAVFELMARTWLCANGALTARQIHGGTVSIVSAKAQAAAAWKLLVLLDDEELAVFKRGRNAHVSPPRSSTFGEYHAATALEALFGYLYLLGRVDRLNELFAVVIEGEY
ncbi:MAG: ribonuclease III [Oscillospiraceae bacterium]|nr:ribonuclease III [Oscillospiraceae bacterium]